ncbi:hypothetical protein RclHR1_08390010 [Rhizophagus clarus]|uniref:Uncharacterized protein n=1 Tax=Rhizophagus clarus TaxID=94130 RepID=A0A2Z6S0S1_9GLOM|nr:hypothetical protein RclHR1_08390010 [Rhizophagus clarus]GET04142.1 hypothetical protein GLOIN_2v1769051 [Rhizophagus clarus]
MIHRVANQTVRANKNNQNSYKTPTIQISMVPFFWKYMGNKDYITRLFSQMVNASSIKSYPYFTTDLQSLRHCYIYTRDPRTAIKWSDTRNRHRHIMFHFQFVFNTQENRRFMTCHRLKKIESICSLQPLQDKKLGSGKIFVKT